VILHNTGSRSSSHQGALSAGLSALAQPFKLRMARSQHETQLWDYSTNVVLIEPLASLQAVEDFLWPRVFRANPPPEARGGANAAAAQAAATARKSSRSTRSKSGKGEEQVCVSLLLHLS
jgi:E3 ubiquitin-protein ligase TRIP12